MMNAFVPVEEVERNVMNDVSTSYDTEDFLFKILVVGDFGVGKTAIIRRYTEGIFSRNYKLTIGVDFAMKSLTWDEKTNVTIQLWDIAGHERFGFMTHVYYKYAAAAIIVFDLSRPATLESVAKWQKDVQEKITLHNGQPLPVILIANKCDIDGVTVENSIINKFCKDHEIPAWFFTSAKENINIKDAIEFLVDKIVSFQRASQKGEVNLVGGGQPAGCIQVHKPVNPSKSSKCCNS